MLGTNNVFIHSLYTLCQNTVLYRKIFLKLQVLCCCRNTNLADSAAGLLVMVFTAILEYRLWWWRKAAPEKGIYSFRTDWPFCHP